MKPEDLASLLDKQTSIADADLLRRLAVSMASFIAEIDDDSNIVAEYIEQRLSPLLSLLSIDFRVRNALEIIASDARAIGHKACDNGESKDGQMHLAGYLAHAIATHTAEGDDE